MARAVRAEPCMFCGTAPCSCGKPDSKPKAKPVVPEVETVVEVRPAVAVPVVEYSNTISTTRPAPQQPKVDKDVVYAVEAFALAGMVDQRELNRIRGALGQVHDASVKQSVQQWKDRHNGTGRQASA